MVIVSKFLVNRRALELAIKGAAAAAMKRCPKPVLLCAKIVADATARQIFVSATNLEQAITIPVTQCDITTGGVILLPLDKLGKMLAAAEHDTVTIESFSEGEGDKATFTTLVKGADSKGTIFGLDPAEFPPISQPDGAADFSLTVESLLQALNQTIFAAAKESTRYAINGLYFTRTADKLEIVSTDGHRLALVKLDVATGADFSAIFPIHAVGMLRQLLKSQLVTGEDVAEFRLRDSRLFVSLASAGAMPLGIFSSPQCEGSFPPFNDIIPRDSDKCVVIDRERTLSALRRVGLMTSEESKGVRLSLHGRNMSITARAPDQGEMSVDMPIDYEGGDVEIGFNPKYLTEALNAVDERMVRLELKESNKPGLIKSGNWQYVCMPVNLK